MVHTRNSRESAAPSVRAAAGRRRAASLPRPTLAPSTCATSRPTMPSFRSTTSRCLEAAG